jgi:hypothetical protein
MPTRRARTGKLLAEHNPLTAARLYAFPDTANTCIGAAAIIMSPPWLSSGDIVGWSSVLLVHNEIRIERALRTPY